jgi:hypothetical protein
MKKILVMMVATFMVTLSVKAQSQDEYYKHEIAVAYGGMSNSNWMSIGDALGTVLVTGGYFSYDDGSFVGPISAEYFYHISPLIGLGAMGVYAKETKDMTMGGKVYGEAKSTYVSVMPGAKFNWLRKKNFGLYSKVGIGPCFRTRSEKYSTDSKSADDSSSDVCFNFQVSALGIEAGANNFWGFIELGLGEQGMGLAGLRVKF